MKREVKTNKKEHKTSFLPQEQRKRVFIADIPLRNISSQVHWVIVFLSATPDWIRRLEPYLRDNNLLAVVTKNQRKGYFAIFP